MPSAALRVASGALVASERIEIEGLRPGSGILERLPFRQRPEHQSEMVAPAALGVLGMGQSGQIAKVGQSGGEACLGVGVQRMRFAEHLGPDGERPGVILTCGYVVAAPRLEIRVEGHDGSELRRLRCVEAIPDIDGADGELLSSRHPAKSRQGCRGVRERRRDVAMLGPRLASRMASARSMSGNA